MLTRSARLGLFLLGTVGAVAGLTERLRAGRRGVASDGWAMAVVLIVVVVKGAFDVVLAPQWATLWYSAPQQFAVAFAVGAFGWMGLRVIGRRSATAGEVWRFSRCLPCCPLAYRAS